MGLWEADPTKDLVGSYERGTPVSLKPLTLTQMQDKAMHRSGQWWPKPAAPNRVLLNCRYRVTSLTRNRTTLALYSRIMSRALGWS